MKKNKERLIFLIVILTILFITALQLEGKIYQKDKSKRLLKDEAVKKFLEKASDSSSISVIVMLKDKNDKDVLKSQSNVLSKFNGDEFKVKHRYSIINGFSGKVTKSGLIKLLNNPDVEGIYEDRIVHVLLPESVPQINADTVWGIQINGENITGKGETICIIDTGVDYTHPDLGNCTPVNYTLSGNMVNYTLESQHPYPNDFDYTWKITQPGFKRISVHFKNFSLEMPSEYDALDRIYVYNSNMVEIAAYRGKNVEDVWTPPSEGDTIYIRLVTDSSVTDYGFYIDKVLNGTANQTLNWSYCRKVIYGYDFVNSDSDPMDDNGHGTHCAGIVAANGSVMGVAPDAKIIAVKVMNSSGSGYSSDIIAGIDFCINNSEIYNISVISMSIGTETHYSSSCDSDFPYYSDAINNAVSHNISVVVASGNNGSASGISAPACIENATPVGAVDKSDKIASFTNRGSGFPEMLLAPGVNINSTWVGGGYLIASGTSMATPHVAGAIALIKQYLRLTNQGRTPQEIEELLNETGKRIYDSGTGMYFSRIDVYSAILSLSHDLSLENLQIPVYEKPNRCIRINVTLRNKGMANESNLTVELRVNNSLNDSVNISKLNSGDSVNITFNLSLSVESTYNITINVTNVVNENILDNNKISKEIIISFIEPVLLVDDDYSDSYEIYYESALRNGNIPYRKWDTYSKGSPPFSELSGFPIVIWFTGNAFSNTLTDTDRNNLKNYLDDGNSLFLTGQDIGYDLVEYGDSSSKEFYNNTLHAVYIKHDTNITVLTGIDEDPISDNLTIDINGSDGAQNQIYPSEIAPADSYGVPIFVYVNDSIGAIRVDTGTYRIVYFAFGFEGIGDSGKRDIIMNRTYTWLNPIGPEVNLISPANNYQNNNANITLICNASDSLGLKNVSFYSNLTGNWSGELINASIGKKSHVVYINKSNILDGKYKWNCLF